jgi:DNA (cytosine-5)-methyltransferase 1
MSHAYYNEHDIHAAAWLRELIKAGEIAPGDVDERSIIDVNPTELLGYTQLHFFAGIGGWSRALRLAGIPDSEPIVTGSCPCQPFSSAGKGEGLNDARHLWPQFFRIISALRPARVVGEQVASPDALVWWDAVCTDLEGEGYAGWAADLCSAGIGAPHIRQRLYWVADASGSGSPQQQRGRKQPEGSAAHSILDRLADAERDGDRGQAESADHLGAQADRSTDQRGGCGGASSRVADATGDRLLGPAGQDREPDGRGIRQSWADPAGSREDGWTSPLDGIRRDADWLHCRDGKWRPVKPGLVPLVDGLPRGVVPSSRIGLAFDSDKTAEARAMRLKGYGNAIDPELAAMFLRAVSA